LSYLVDTNVVSELARPAPNTGVVDWFGSLDEIALSAVSIEELSYGIARAKPSERKRLIPWFEALMAVPARVLAVDERVARAAGELRAARERSGRRVAQADMLIAATALISGRTLVTHNARDFEGCGIAILDPFVE
jgi:predicted nucleic acid-binding protein